MTVLDHTDNLRIAQPESDERFEELMALHRMAAGLWWLYQMVLDWERILSVEAQADDVQLAIVGGILENKPMEVLSCAFQWYAVSVCSYARLVGWLATGDSKSARDYIQKVMPRVYNYRNKIAAHFALTDPRNDNEADLEASIMTQVIYYGGRLCAGSLTPILGPGENEISVSRELSWSLTMAHQRLTPRYWPDGPPAAYQSIRVPPGTSTFNVSFPDL